MTPTIGRDVQYQMPGSACGAMPEQTRAATITEVNPDDPTEVGLVVFHPTRVEFLHAVKQAPDGATAAGCWNWPPRAR
ncbi:MAG TPA: hypothetical protein VLZ78_02670 [Terrimesophilobacter sp.]|nr:hypothetical protein [Terrimesophilobacter sp.]